MSLERALEVNAAPGAEVNRHQGRAAVADRQTKPAVIRLHQQRVRALPGVVVLLTGVQAVERYVQAGVGVGVVDALLLEIAPRAPVRARCAALFVVATLRCKMFMNPAV